MIIFYLILLHAQNFLENCSSCRMNFVCNEIIKKNLKNWVLLEKLVFNII